MGTKWPRFSKFYRLGWGRGDKDKVLCFYEDWLSEGAPWRAVRATERDRESLGLLLPCFPITRSLPFHAGHSGEEEPNVVTMGSSPFWQYQKQMLAPCESGDQRVHL